MNYYILLSLLWVFAGALPVRKDGGGENKAEEPSARPASFGDVEEYKRYLDEVVRNNPGKMGCRQDGYLARGQQECTN